MARITQIFLCILLLNMHLLIARERPRIVFDTQELLQNRKVPTSPKQAIEEKRKKVLAQFFNIVTNFFSILQDPRNAAHVTANVSNMLASAVNMVAEGIKKGELSMDATEEELLEYIYHQKKLELYQLDN